MNTEFITEINDIARGMKKAHLDVSHIVTRHNIDAEHYADWLTGNHDDFAELLVLYLPQEIKKQVVTDINANITTH